MAKKKLDKFRLGNRVDSFVIVPVNPTTIDVDRSFDIHSPMNQDNIAFGRRTLEQLLRSKRKIYRDIILLNPDIHNLEQHTLVEHLPFLAKDKQFKNLSFYIAGHGTPERVCPSLYESQTLDDNTGFDPLTLAKFIDKTFKQAGDLYDFFRKIPLVFDFMACNSAYTAIQGIGKGEEIQRQVLAESYIGVFSRAMKDLGYVDLTVFGYIGYFSTLKAKHGAVVQDSYENPTTQTLASRSRVAIVSKGQELPAVFLPDQMLVVNLGGTMVAKLSSEQKIPDEIKPTRRKWQSKVRSAKSFDYRKNEKAVGIHLGFGGI